MAGKDPRSQPVVEVAASTEGDEAPRGQGATFRLRFRVALSLSKGGDREYREYLRKE
jgi:hypothetical protein